MEEVEKFIRTLRAENTKKSYGIYINSFLNYKNIKTLEEFRKLDSDDYYEWKDYLLNIADNSESTVKLKLAALCSFYKYLISNPKYGFTVNPIEQSDMIKKLKNIRNPERITWMTANELERFLDNCHTPRDIAMFTLLSNTAIRISELINLDLSKYNRYTNKDGEKAAFIYFIRKGGYKRQLFLNPYVTEKIERYLKVRKESEYTNLFISYGGKPMTSQSIDRTIRTIAQRAGINKNISAHSFRRSLATDMYQEGKDIAIIQNTLGHSSPNTTELYIQEMASKNEDIMMGYVVKSRSDKKYVEQNN